MSTQPTAPPTAPTPEWPYPLLTPRISITPLSARHLDAFTAYRRVPEVAQYQGWTPEYTRSDAARLVSDMDAAMASRGDGLPVPGEWMQLAVEERVDGLNDLSGTRNASDPAQSEPATQSEPVGPTQPRLIGDVAVGHSSDARDTYTIGVTISPSHQGLGYARESVPRVLKWLFEVRGAHRVQASCDIRNERSRGLLLACGFRDEGTVLEEYEHKGEWESVYKFGMLDREWRVLAARGEGEGRGK